jgi:hypothetical protein
MMSYQTQTKEHFTTTIGKKFSLIKMKCPKKTWNSTALGLIFGSISRPNATKASEMTKVGFIKSTGMFLKR